MNHDLNDPRHPWSRLTAAARRVRDDRESSAPFGFATRVAALALAHERQVASLFDRLALRAVGVASLLALFSIVLNYPVLSGEPSATTVASQVEEAELVAATDDAVAIVLDFAD